MEWFNNYQLILFDFDGLLVNTEELHFAAYKKMCRERGFELKWDFSLYAKRAHYSAIAIREALLEEFPPLKEVAWDELYREKKRLYTDLILGGGVDLMEGVGELLTRLERAELKSCVVTHSPLEHISLIRQKLPILNTIPHWITREDYQEPKPHPECYMKAIAALAHPGDRVIGFEDSPRGLSALIASGAESVLISNSHLHGEVAAHVGGGFSAYPSFNSLL